MSLRLALAACAVLLLGSCAVTRPASVTCAALPVQPSGPQLAPDLPMASAMVEKAVAAAVEEAPPGPVTVSVITLSAGGQWGAFGAGFLTGWSRNPVTPRPEFDVVTGVSAGAIMAPAVFAGSRFDDRLAFYRGLSEREVFRRRGPLALLRAPSAVSPEPLEMALKAALSPDLIAAIARRHDDGAQLLISAVNLDTTRREVFDLGAVAGDARLGLAMRAECMTEAMLASGAIPGVFPPRHINDALYVDGGLREQVFFEAVDLARVRTARRTGRDVRIDAYVIVNGPLEPPEGKVEDRLLGYVERAVVTLADEVLRDSIVEAVDFAAIRPGWTVRGVVPKVDRARCGLAQAPSGTFDACLTALLFDTGRRMGGTGKIDWLGARELRDAAAEL